ncbi:hypothetical protein KIM372_06250 [Bombiscardovia nodaiensis]|uniref:Uncharacterized protein n=1 Tax=Bombiscardovia nodaiensis TaxID=2932181 RepID=A0ABN6SB88_9BIFI|nr:hypothetical protein KIM372_06250 [Bombiscardovia nodaiensis]
MGYRLMDDAGPFRFRVDYEGFKQYFHGANDRYVRKLGLVGGVAAAPYGLIQLWNLIDFFRGGHPFDDFSDGVACVGMILLWLFFLCLLVRPVFLFVFRRGDVADFLGFWVLRGLRVWILGG